MELFTTENAIAFFTLTSLEIVLGIDNVIFIAILAGKLPEKQRNFARQLGISLAVITRIGLLFAIGFCGSFTTLSSLVLEMNTMIQKNEIFYSFSYFVATMLGGFACFYIGIQCVRLLMKLQAS